MKEEQGKNSENDINKKEDDLSSYKDQYVDLSSKGLKIDNYYFPFLQAKNIPISKISNINLIELNHLNGKSKVFGLDIKFVYYHLDWKRPKKTHAITLKEEGNFLTIGITPEDPQKCFNVLNYLSAHQDNKKISQELKGIEEENSLIKEKQKLN